MEKIKIYKSFWKLDLGLALCLTFGLWGGYMLRNEKWEFKAGPIILIIMFGIFAIVTVIRYIWRRPQLIITDKAVTVNTYDPWEVRFEDVESFSSLKHKGLEVIAIRYKQGTEHWAPEEEIENSRRARVRYPENLHPGKPYEIYVAGLSLDCQQICDILNDRRTITTDRSF